MHCHFVFIRYHVIPNLFRNLKLKRSYFCVEPGNRNGESEMLKRVQHAIFTIICHYESFFEGRRIRLIALAQITEHY